MTGDEAGEVGRVMHGLKGQVKDVVLNYKRAGKPSEGAEESVA